MINEFCDYCQITREQLEQIKEKIDLYCEEACIIAMQDINDIHVYTFDKYRGNWYITKKALTKYIRMGFDFEDTFFTQVKETNRILPILLKSGWEIDRIVNGKYYLQLTKKDFQNVWCK